MTCKGYFQHWGESFYLLCFDITHRSQVAWLVTHLSICWGNVLEKLWESAADATYIPSICVLYTHICIGTCVCMRICRSISRGVISWTHPWIIYFQPLNSIDKDHRGYIISKSHRQHRVSWLLYLSPFWSANSDVSICRSLL